jgi:hypothetical protein
MVMLASAHDVQLFFILNDMTILLCLIISLRKFKLGITKPRLVSEAIEVNMPKHVKPSILTTTHNNLEVTPSDSVLEVIWNSNTVINSYLWLIFSLYMYILMKVIVKTNYLYDFHFFKLNNLKIIHDLYSQCLTQILSKNDF